MILGEYSGFKANTHLEDVPGVFEKVSEVNKRAEMILELFQGQ